MADKPTDDATAAPPPRRAPRTKSAAKTKRTAAPKTPRRAPAKPATVSEAVAVPKQAVKRAATAAKGATAKAVTRAKPKVKAVAKKAVAAEKAVAKSGVGKGFLIGGALAAIAAAIAGIFGRKKIADATAKSIDTVMGKPDDTAGKPTMSAD